MSRMMMLVCPPMPERRACRARLTASLQQCLSCWPVGDAGTTIETSTAQVARATARAWREAESLAQASLAGGFELELKLRSTRPHRDQGMVMEHRPRDALPSRCAHSSCRDHETKSALSSMDLQVTGGNNGSVQDLDDDRSPDPVPRENVSAGDRNSLNGPFRRRSQACRSRCSVAALASMKKKSGNTASKGRAVAEL